MAQRRRRTQRNRRTDDNFMFDFRVTRATNVYDYVQRLTVEALKTIGAYTRQTAMTRVLGRANKRAKVSEPGQPWSNRLGFLKKSIAFGVSEQNLYVVIGPGSPRSHRTAPRALEYGGTSRGTKTIHSEREREARTTYKKTRRRRSAKGQTVVQQNKIARRIREYYDRPENRHKRLRRRSDTDPSKKVVINYRIRRRPAMAISLRQTIPQMPNAWKFAARTFTPRPPRFFGPGGVSGVRGWNYATFNRHSAMS